MTDILFKICKFNLFYSFFVSINKIIFEKIIYSFIIISLIFKNITNDFWSPNQTFKIRKIGKERKPKV